MNSVPQSPFIPRPCKPMKLHTLSLPECNNLPSFKFKPMSYIFSPSPLSLFLRSSVGALYRPPGCFPSITCYKKNLCFKANTFVRKSIFIHLVNFTQDHHETHSKLLTLSTLLPLFLCFNFRKRFNEIFLFQDERIAHRAYPEFLDKLGTDGMFIGEIYIYKIAFTDLSFERGQRCRTKRSCN